MAMDLPRVLGSGPVYSADRALSIWIPIRGDSIANGCLLFPEARNPSALRFAAKGKGQTKRTMHVFFGG
jgi:hypothetical protein